jgi:DNA-binding transcriptional MocR family regulator
MTSQDNIKTSPWSRLDEFHQRLVKLLAGNPAVSVRNQAASLGVSKGNIEQALLQLQADGWLRRIGPKFGGRWEVLEAPENPLPPAPPADAVLPGLPPGLPPDALPVLREQMEQAFEAAHAAYLAAWERRDPDADLLRQRQKHLGGIVLALQAARLRRVGADLASQNARFQATNTGLEQSIVQLQETVRRTGRAIDVAGRIDQLLVLVANLAH